MHGYDAATTQIFKTSRRKIVQWVAQIQGMRVTISISTSLHQQGKVPRSGDAFGLVDVSRRGDDFARATFILRP